MLTPRECTSPFPLVIDPLTERVPFSPILALNEALPILIVTPTDDRHHWPVCVWVENVIGLEFPVVVVVLVPVVVRTGDNAFGKPREDHGLAVSEVIEVVTLACVPTTRLAAARARAAACDIKVAILFVAAECRLVPLNPLGSLIFAGLLRQ